MQPNTNHKKIKLFLFFIVLLLLWIPILQKVFTIVKERPLGGAITTIEQPSCLLKYCITGEYQTKMDEYLKSSFGFRNSLIRLNNQKMYSFFNVVKAKNVVIGKENYLFEESYITSYLGQNYVGEELVNKNIKKLVKVKDFLKTKGKDIIFVIAPGKASFFPEYIPKKYNKLVKGKTNYEAYLEAFKKNNINYIDFREWFLENKKKSKYPLYPKCGIHWSKYGEYLVTDSLIKYIEKLRKIDLPELVLDSLVISNKSLFEDSDIEHGMNLIVEIPTSSLAYPYTHIEENKLKKTVKTLVVGDSYYWGLYNREISEKIFDKGEFWYYNKEIFSSLTGGSMYIERIELNKSVEENELFIMFFSEMNLVNFDYGFSNLLYNHLFITKGEQQKNRFEYFIERIKSSPKWLHKIKKQAEELKIPLDQMIRENAIFMVNKENAI